MRPPPESSFGAAPAGLTLFRCFRWAQNDMHMTGACLVPGWMGSPVHLEFHLREESEAEVAPCT